MGLLPMVWLIVRNRIGTCRKEVGGTKILAWQQDPPYCQTDPRMLVS